MPARPFIELIWTPLPQVIAGIYFEVAERAQEMAEPLQEITEVFSAEIEANFEAEGRPTRWEPLAESTEKQKGTGGKILQRTGELRAAATSADSWAIGPAPQGAIAVLEDPTGYGIFHVEGTRSMSQRDWTYISDEAMAEAEDFIFDWVTEPWEQ